MHNLIQIKNVDTDLVDRYYVFNTERQNLKCASVLIAVKTVFFIIFLAILLN